MRRLLPILIALAVFAPSLAGAAAWFRCSQDGVTRAHCCCPPKAAQPDDRAPISEVRASSCCDVINAAAAPSSARNIAAVDTTLDAITRPAPVLLATVTISPVRLDTLPRLCGAVGPPDPLFARHCALLL